MTKGIYVIYDKVALECGEPFLAKTDGVAERMFADTVRNVIAKQKNIRLKDFQLRFCGNIDTETLEIEPGSAVIITADDPTLGVACDGLDVAKQMTDKEVAEARAPIEEQPKEV